MSYDSTYSYSTAADYARLLGCDRTTVLAYIRQGKIRAWEKTKRNERIRIYKKYFRKSVVRSLMKPYPKQSKTWSRAELHVLQTMKGRPAGVVAKMLGRTTAAVKTKRCRLRKAKTTGGPTE